MSEQTFQPTTETPILPTQSQAPNGEDATDATDAAEDPNPYAKFSSFEDLPTRTYFAPAERESFVHYISKLEELRPKSVAAFQYSGKFDDDATIVVTKVAESREFLEGGKKVTRRVTSAVVAWPIPSHASFIAIPKGAKFVNDALLGAAVAEIIKPLRGKNNEERENVLESVPVTVADFAASGREGVMKVVNDLLKQLLAKMKKEQPKNKFLKTCSIAMLRQCMMHAELARQFAPKLEAQGIFVAWINGMKHTMEQAGKNAQVLGDWLAQRDEVEDDDEDDDDTFDFSDLSSLKIE